MLTDAPLDYSARGEAALLRSGRSGLRVAFRDRARDGVRRARAGADRDRPGRAARARVPREHIVLGLARPGTYRVALHYSPYLAAVGACIRESSDGMVVLRAQRPGRLELAFTVTASHALAAISGSRSSC